MIKKSQQKENFFDLALVCSCHNDLNSAAEKPLKIDNLEQKIDALIVTVTKLTDKIKAVGAKLDKITTRVGELEKKWKNKKLV